MKKLTKIQRSKSSGKHKQTTMAKW